VDENNPYGVTSGSFTATNEAFLCFFFGDSPIVVDAKKKGAFRCL
jgi:hypothetical protein